MSGEITRPPLLRWPGTAFGLAALTAMSAASGWCAAQLMGRATAGPHIAEVRAALKLRLPKTPIDSVTCRDLGGLCEVTSKTTLFYTDAQARYLMIGRVYDMETRQDLTAARLLALNPDLLAAGAARHTASEENTPTQQRSAPAKVSLAGLPANGAIVWGPANGPKVTVFSDFQCSYCKRLSAELAAIGARVEERPISIFGAAARQQAEQVLCAKDPSAALHAAYAGTALARAVRAAPCDTAGLDANETFAKAHGFAGTPVIVRPSDGAVLEGYRDAAALRAFLGSGAPASPPPSTPKG
jgi:thiol:disulfide interchange protein DsbC